MADSLLRNALTLVLGVLSFAMIYVFAQFASAGIFSTTTMALVGLGALSMLLATAASPKEVQEYVEESMDLDTKIYLITITLFLCAAVISVYLGISLGGSDYTQHLAE